MGQKVNPHGLRVGVIKDWDSKWYAEGDFADNLVGRRGARMAHGGDGISAAGIFE